MCAGLKIVILFDTVTISRGTVTFSGQSLHGGRVETGSIERDLDAWGDVGDWLQEHATAPTPRY